MTNILQEIAEVTRKRIDVAKEHMSEASLVSRFEASQRKLHDMTSIFVADSWNVIAEYKRASPSQGDIAPTLKHLTVAKQYIDSGAKALSVLTEPHYFRGDLNFLAEIREAYPKQPLLMKDFFVDSYQIAQALAYGADCILIIAAMLDQDQAVSLYRSARSFGLSVILEIHGAAELSYVEIMPDAIVGINNRNLKNMTIDLKISEDLIPLIPKERKIISESGIESFADLVRLKTAGAKGFLVGTSLMRSGEPGLALSRLLKQGL